MKTTVAGMAAVTIDHELRNSASTSRGAQLQVAL